MAVLEQRVAHGADRDVARLFALRPLLSALPDASADMDDTPVQIDVLPAQRQDLALAHTGLEGQKDHRPPLRLGARPRKEALALLEGEELEVGLLVLVVLDLVQLGHAGQ